MAGRPSAELPATVAWQLSRASGKMIWTDTHKSTCIHTFKHLHIQVHKQLHACTHTHTHKHMHTKQVNAQMQTCASCSFLCKGNMKRGNLVYRPPLKISQTNSLFSSLSLSVSFLSDPPATPPIC